MGDPAHIKKTLGGKTFPQYTAERERVLKKQADRAKKEKDEKLKELREKLAKKRTIAFLRALEEEEQIILFDEKSKKILEDTKELVMTVKKMMDHGYEVERETRRGKMAPDGLERMAIIQEGLKGNTYTALERLKKLRKSNE